MRARDKFRIGMRVRMSRAGLEQFRYSPALLKRQRGVVVGFQRGNELSVRVKRDDTVTPVLFHGEFWEQA